MEDSELGLLHLEGKMATEYSRNAYDHWPPHSFLVQFCTYGWVLRLLNHFTGQLYWRYSDTQCHLAFIKVRSSNVIKRSYLANVITLIQRFLCSDLYNEPVSLNNCVRRIPSALVFLYSFASSWIGSVNAFLFEICGLISGQLYDRGYW
jgi:hypothetical protein